MKTTLNIDDSVVAELKREAALSRSIGTSLKVQSAAEASFLADAVSHGVGPHGFSIPLTENGHGALFSISHSGTEQEWKDFLATRQPMLIQIANQLHHRAVVEVFGEDRKE
jgi:hypothetical protein